MTAEDRSAGQALYQQPATAGDVNDRLRRLERLIDDTLRPRSGDGPNLRDLRDAHLAKVTAGQAALYSSRTGRWEPGSVIPPFVHPGTVTLSVSGRWYPEVDRRVRHLFASLATTSTSGDVTVLLLRNGLTVATLTIAEGDVTAAVDLDETWYGPESDHMQAEVTDAGTGAAELVVQPS